jgi:hypothetical protein
MRVDTSRFDDTAAVAASLHAREESLLWSPRIRVDKYSPDQVEYAVRKIGRQRAPQGDDFARLGIAPDEVAEAEGNLLTTAGLTRITSLIIGGGGQAATNTAARIGVGDSTTAAAVGDTDLGAAAGSTHRWFQVMDATYPTVSAGVMTFRSTFGTADGNFTAGWQEFGIDIGTPTVSSANTVNATLLNHKIVSLGTKVSGATWTCTATISIS